MEVEKGLGSKCSNLEEGLESLSSVRRGVRLSLLEGL